MATLLLLKRKIKTAQNVSKTTKAMQMIATSKLNRAQIAALSSRPFVEKITALTKSVSYKLDDENRPSYMRKSDNDHKLAVVFSPDKGLCGGVNTNIIRQVLDFDEKEKNVSYLTVGKKAEFALAGGRKDLIASFDFGTTLPIFDQVFPILEIIDEYFLSGKVGSVKVICTHFKSVFSQGVAVSDLLPIKIEEQGETNSTSSTLFEPSATEILPPLLRQYLEMNLYQFFLENYLSYQAAQMVAMQNATDNALELLKDLKLMYNKSRQERITNEILDISSGAMFAYEQE